MSEFKLVSDYKPCGDQPQAVDRLVEGINLDQRAQTLWGYRFGENIYHGKCYSKSTKAYPCNCP